MIALVALTESTITPKKPIDPATMEIMCSAPAQMWTHFTKKIQVSDTNAIFK